MQLRDAAPIEREQWVLPLLIAIFLAGMELLRSAGHRVPGAGAVALIGVIYTAYRAGIIPAVIGASALTLFTLRSVDAGVSLSPLALIIAVFGCVLLVGWLSGKQRAALQDAVRAREQAQRSEERYRDLVEGLEATVWEADADNMRVRFVSKRAERMFGFATSEWIGSSQIWRRLIHPDDFERVRAETRRAVNAAHDQEREYRVVTRSNEVLHVRDILHLDTSVVPPVLRGILFNVTPERRAVDALQDSERKLRAFMNNAPDVLLVHDVNGRIVEVNQRASDCLGYTRDEMLAMNMSDLDMKRQESGERPDPDQIARGPVTSEGLFKHSNGATIPFEIVTSMWEARPELFIALARDVTRKTELEEQLRRAQRMEAVGRLAGGIAHDFNNLLTAIRGHAEMLANEFGAGAHGDLHEITKAADRAAGLTRQLLAFSRQQMLQLEVLDLNVVVSEMNLLLARAISENIELVMSLDPLLVSIKGDRAQLEQVVMNLVLNARDAMPAGGRIHIRTANAVLTEVDAGRMPYVRPGNYVLLSVADTGTGINADSIPHIFDPFFTTKEQGKGTGLGLATAYGIIKQLGGYIWCESQQGVGSTFRVYLPPTEDAPVARKGTRTASSADRRDSETILLVEDEPAVRSLVRRVLEKQGYRVIDAGNGVEALDVASNFYQRIHLLLTDVVMPQMGGRDLADRLSPQRPDMKILYMSGYAEDAIVVNHILQPGFAFLQKPFAPETLTAKVRETLES